MRQLSPVSRRFWQTSLLVAVAGVLVLLSACGEAAPTQTQPKVYLPPQPPLSGLPAAALQGTLQGLMPQNTTLHLTIGLRMNRQGLAQAAQRIYDPTSPQYGQYLSVQQIAQQFGASSQAIQKVTNWLSSQGFQILSTSP